MHLLRSLLALVGTVALLFAQVPGGIYTTDGSGSRFGAGVYDGIFDGPLLVYLAGGPERGAPCSAPGLPDGDYYFQVTDATGALLLSSDAITNRKIAVTGGVISGTIGSTHLTGNGPCGSRVVKLAPFLPTPFSGGEYTAWITPVGDYDPLGTGFFGFQAALSRTTNFVIRDPSTPTFRARVSGSVFYDHNEDGVFNPNLDPLEVPVGGWRVDILRNGMPDGVAYTDAAGRFTVLREKDFVTTYTFEVKAPGGFVGDGLPGAVWVAKTARTAALVANQLEATLPGFGAIAFEVDLGAGRTSGFWGDTLVGRERMEQSDPIWREVLTVRKGLPVCLRRHNNTPVQHVSLFVPYPVPYPFWFSYLHFEHWINSYPNDHAGFLLSREVAATILNNAIGFMQGTVYVDRFNNGILVSLDDLLAGAIGLLCDPLASQTGRNGRAQALRAQMLACLNEFGGINSTGDLNAPQVVYRKSDVPLLSQSPY